MQMWMRRVYGYWPYRIVYKGSHFLCGYCKFALKMDTWAPAHNLWWTNYLNKDNSTWLSCNHIILPLRLMRSISKQNE